MDALRKKKNVTKLNLGRIKDSMSDVCGSGISCIKALSKLEELIAEYHRHLKIRYDDIVENMLEMLDENSETYQASCQKLLEESKVISEVLANYAAEAKKFHKKLATEEARQSRVGPNQYSPDLNASFVNNQFNPS